MVSRRLQKQATLLKIELRLKTILDLYFEFHSVSVMSILSLLYHAKIYIDTLLVLFLMQIA